MSDSVSATQPPKLEIKTDAVFTTDGTNQHLRSVVPTSNNATLINPPRTTPDIRMFNSQIIRGNSMDTTQNPTKSMYEIIISIVIHV